MGQRLDDFADLKRELLLALKRGGPSTIAALAGPLRVTREGARLHLAGLERDGWVRRRGGPRGSGPGRPVARYELTAAGEELFPKAYDALAVEMLDAVADQFGTKALKKVLTALVEARVKRFEPRLRGLSLEKRLERLKELYLADDPFMSVEREGAQLRLVERNCPFFSVASRRPALCSVTVNTMSRLLGRRVAREERFQAGHGRCSFVVKLREKVPPRFEFEA
ncbi:MAG TPA: DNA-binding protein [Elusimicrobiota bacterium]|nr:DNA-binding protein [Elusimicrobiota bacterium]